MQLMLALPPEHQVEPQVGEVVDGPQTGYTRLQDWVFARAFPNQKIKLSRGCQRSLPKSEKISSTAASSPKNG